MRCWWRAPLQPTIILSRRPQRYTSGYLDLSQQQPRWSEQRPPSSPHFVTPCRPPWVLWWRLPPSLGTPAVSQASALLWEPLTIVLARPCSLTAQNTFPSFLDFLWLASLWCLLQPQLELILYSALIWQQCWLDGAVCNDPSRAVLDECWKVNPFTWTGNAEFHWPVLYYL